MPDPAEIRRQVVAVVHALDQASIHLDAVNGPGHEIGASGLSDPLMRAQRTARQLLAILERPPVPGSSTRPRANEPGA